MAEYVNEAGVRVQVSDEIAARLGVGWRPATEDDDKPKRGRPRKTAE